MIFEDLVYVSRDLLHSDLNKSLFHSICSFFHDMAYVNLIKGCFKFIVYSVL